MTVAYESYKFTHTHSFPVATRNIIKINGSTPLETYNLIFHIWVPNQLLYEVLSNTLNIFSKFTFCYVIH